MANPSFRQQCRDASDDDERGIGRWAIASDVFWAVSVSKIILQTMIRWCPIWLSYVQCTVHIERHYDSLMASGDALCLMQPIGCVRCEIDSFRSFLCYIGRCQSLRLMWHQMLRHRASCWAPTATFKWLGHVLTPGGSDEWTLSSDAPMASPMRS
jgi:hypothetical protein